MNNQILDDLKHIALADKTLRLKLDKFYADIEKIYGSREVTVTSDQSEYTMAERKKD